MYKVLFSIESLDEIRETVYYYNRKSKGLGDRFKSNLLKEIKMIRANPLSRSFRYDEVRFAVIDNFPYSAHYTVDETNRVIKIQAVLGFKQADKTNWNVRF